MAEGLAAARADAKALKRAGLDTISAGNAGGDEYGPGRSCFFWYILVLLWDL